MSKRETFPPSRAEVHALSVLDQVEADQLVMVPASIIAGLCADIELWRDIACRDERLQ